MSRFFIGAYAALPSTHATSAQPDGDATLLAGLASDPRVAGLELPVHADGALHRFDEPWLLAQLPDQWAYVLTCLPGTMTHLGTSPVFGLASEDENGRTEALRFAGAALSATRRLARLGRSVKAVAFHSAPRRASLPGAAATAALTRSLRELRRWDWGGAEVWVEHCDAFTTEHPPAKGFLSLDVELAALAATDDETARAGLLVNWGRSVVEARRAAAAAEHVRRAAAAGALRGLMFSGVCTGHPDYGAWEDSHAPFTPTPTSLLTVEAAGACLAAAGPAPLACLGVKIQTLPATLAPAERLALVRQALDQLEATPRGE